MEQFEHAGQWRLQLTEHTAAVGALDWCPFSRELLVSGAGTTDQTVKVWNANSGKMLNSTPTGSQVCAVLWSRDYHHQRELVSAHGGNRTELNVWSYQRNDSNCNGMQKLHEVLSHTKRVIDLAMSPDGDVASVSADETIRFWNIFSRLSAPKKHFRTTSLPEFGIPPIR